MISRKKYAAALRFLKAALSNERLPFAQRLRCVELLLAIYGDLDAQPGKRDRRAVKELIEERAIERQTNEFARHAVLDGTVAQAVSQRQVAAQKEAAEAIRRYRERQTQEGEIDTDAS
jgi:hypothetical protein